MTICTDKVWALKTARRDIEQKVARMLPPRHAGRCDRCHKVLVQKSRELLQMRACSALDEVLKLARNNGHTTVTAVGSRVVFFGGCIFRSLRRCRVFFMEDLFWLFAAACSLRFAYAGTQVWSFLGLPIGGLLSKVAASTVLGWQEHCWNFDQNRRQVAQYWWDDRLWMTVVSLCCSWAIR